MCDSIERVIGSETATQLREVEADSLWDPSLIKFWKDICTDGLVDFRARIEDSKLIFHAKMWFLPKTPNEMCRVVYGLFTFTEGDLSCKEYALYWGVDENSLRPRHLDRWRGHEQFIQRLSEGGIGEEDFFFVAKGVFRDSRFQILQTPEGDD